MLHYPLLGQMMGIIWGFDLKGCVYSRTEFDYL